MPAQSSSDEKRVPKHIVIIPDGNRRWARAKGLDVLKGHEKGIENIGEVLKWCKEFGVHNITLWGFSSENRGRSQDEVQGLMRLFEKNLFDILNRAEQEKGKESEYPKVHVKFYGDLGAMPQKLQMYMRELEGRTKENGEYFVNFLLNYGGSEELVACVRKVAEDYKSGKLNEINEQEIMGRLWTGELPRPDLIIRTSGEYRLSGVMPVQSGYSELFFVNKLWPDFSKEDFEAVLDEFARRERRFGK